MPKSTKPSCQITVSLYSGRREPLKTDAKILLTLLNGFQKQVHRAYHQASRVVFKKLPFHNNFGDSYTVVAWAEGFRQIGFTPIKVTPEIPGTIDLMLLRDNPEYNFHEARWETLVKDPAYARVLKAGAADEDAAARRYTDLLEHRPAALACFLNIFTALREIHLPEGTPVDYVQELIWDESMAQDRFFAWADARLVSKVERAAAGGAFAPEPGAGIFHPGATSSYKQMQFGEANVQITFHENDKRTVQRVPCIKVELDMDYYKDPAAHALLEVLNHSLTGSMTDPAQVYVLRWIAGRHAGVAGFEPPYRLV
ncbi:MAG: hypothetical protein ACM3S5_05165 [Rhodospirillales bacterium]